VTVVFQDTQTEPSAIELARRPPTATWHPSVVRSHLFLHCFLLAIGVIVVALSMLMRTTGQTAVFLPGFDRPLPPSCTTQVLFGLDCPGCGMTRAFISIGHGQFQQAWRFNAASFVVYPFIAVQIPWNLLQIGMLLWRKRAIELPYVYWLPVLVAIVLMMHWLWRLSF
jgi:hypothetical protein